MNAWCQRSNKHDTHRCSCIKFICECDKLTLRYVCLINRLHVFVSEILLFYRQCVCDGLLCEVGLGVNLLLHLSLVNAAVRVLVGLWRQVAVDGERCRDFL